VTKFKSSEKNNKKRGDDTRERKTAGEKPPRPTV
jgi:hypothetical protein